MHPLSQPQQPRARIRHRSRQDRQDRRVDRHNNRGEPLDERETPAIRRGGHRVLVVLVVVVVGEEGASGLVLGGGVRVGVLLLVVGQEVFGRALLAVEGPAGHVGHGYHAGGQLHAVPRAAGVGPVGFWVDAGSEEML